jgi:hypothetical protein
MRYGFVSRRNKDTVERHIKALEPYKLDKVIVDDFEHSTIMLLDKLNAGDCVYMYEPPRDTHKFFSIYNYAKDNGVTVYVKGNPVNYSLFNILEELRRDS